MGTSAAPLTYWAWPPMRDGLLVSLEDILCDSWFELVSVGWRFSCELYEIDLAKMHSAMDVEVTSVDVLRAPPQGQ
jgi:hypothetical protein